MEAASKHAWEDATPVNADEGLAAVVCVQCSLEDAATMDLFHAVLKTGELSARVFTLTEDVSPSKLIIAFLSCGLLLVTFTNQALAIEVRGLYEQVIAVNASDYNAWEVRWRCLQILPHTFMEKEAEFLDRMLMYYPKNYQLWNYRRRFAFHRGAEHASEVHMPKSATMQNSANSRATVILATPDILTNQGLLCCSNILEDQNSKILAAAHIRSGLAQELAYVSKCLDGDAKNYHAWAHRVAVAERYSLWEQEPEVVARLLEQDVRNNSAWNHRFAAVSYLAKE